MARIAFGMPQALEDSLIGDALRHGHEVVARCSSADELASRLDAAAAEFAIVAGSSRYLTDRLIRASDEAGVAIVALIETEQERRNAAALGLYETLPADTPWAVIEQSIARTAPSAPPAVAPAPTASSVIGVWGPAGAPGRTTLAIGIASELAASGARVVLADVDTHAASVAPSLGLLDEAPGFAAACRLASTDSLTLAELDRIAETYESSSGSFRVLTGIGRPSRWPELSSERVARVIGACRSWADYVVVDTGSSLENDEEISSDLAAPRRNGATITALRESDHLVAVGAADPVGMARFLRANVDLVELATTERMTVVMNKLRPTAIGLGAAAQVTQTLHRFGGIGDPVLVPYDRSALDAAILSGRTLADVAPKSPARLAIAQLVADRILPRPVESARRWPRRAGGAANAAAGLIG